MIHLAEISPSHIDDLVPILDLYAQARDQLLLAKIHQWDEFYPSRELIADDIKRKVLYKLCIRKEILGAIGLSPEKEEEYDEIQFKVQTKYALYVNRLVVHPRFQGKGFGKKLMRFAETLGKEQKMDAIRLSTYSENVPSIAFYEGLGYMHVGQYFYAHWEQPFEVFEKEL